MKQRKEIPIGAGTLIIESGHLAKQANGSCTVRLGDTVVLATACMEHKGRRRTRDFLPLTVDYREYTYAAGRIPGGFFKREGRPTEKEIITSRQIDRPLRPLFPEGYIADTQIIAFCLSADGENDPDILAINGASIALVLSDIPFYHPVGAVRVGLIDGEVVMNPTNSLRDVSDLDLVVVGTEEAVVMVEAGANQVSEELILECIFRGHQEIQKIIKAQHELFRERQPREAVLDGARGLPRVALRAGQGRTSTRRSRPPSSPRRSSSARTRSTRWSSRTSSRSPRTEADKKRQVKKIVSRLEEEILREVVLNERTRFDSRRLDEIRPIDDRGRRAPPHPRLGALHPRRDPGPGHGDARHQPRRPGDRGVRGGERPEVPAALQLPALLRRRGEVPARPRPARDRPRRAGPPGARCPVLPHEDEFPYTIRVVSDILESNGSSSMATVCGGSLALFDAGVPLLAPVAGVAMGLIKERRQLRGPDRHRRPGRPLRRHGLQGRRHPRRASPRSRWTSRSPASPARS